MSASSSEADSKSISPVFIQGRLDDYGLTSNQFRIYCHIARRGECFESVPKMAKHCRLTRNTVWRALNYLTERKLIERSSRKGKTTLLRITPLSLWLSPAHPPQKEAHPKRSTTTQPKIEPTHPPQKEGHKVTPIEVTPLKGEKPPELWKQLKDLKEVERRINELQSSVTPDVKLLRALRAQREKIKESIRQSDPEQGQPKQAKDNVPLKAEITAIPNGDRPVSPQDWEKFHRTAGL